MVTWAASQCTPARTSGFVRSLLSTAMTPAQSTTTAAPLVTTAPRQRCTGTAHSVANVNNPT